MDRSQSLILILRGKNKHYTVSLALRGVYLSFMYVHCDSMMQKKQYLRVHWQKVSKASLKIAQPRVFIGPESDHWLCLSLTD